MASSGLLISSRWQHRKSSPRLLLPGGPLPSVPGVGPRRLEQAIVDVGQMVGSLISVHGVLAALGGNQLPDLPRTGFPVLPSTGYQKT